MQNTTTHNNKDDERHSLLEKYTSHFIWKGCVWEGVGDRTELQRIDPPNSIGHQYFFPVLLGCSTGGLASLGAGFLYRILSPLVWSPTLNQGPEGSLCWVLDFSTASFSNWSDLQTDWLPVFTEL